MCRKRLARVGVIGIDGPQSGLLARLYSWYDYVFRAQLRHLFSELESQLREVEQARIAQSSVAGHSAPFAFINCLCLG